MTIELVQGRTTARRLAEEVQLVGMIESGQGHRPRQSH